MHVPSPSAVDSLCIVAFQLPPGATPPSSHPQGQSVLKPWGPRVYTSIPQPPLCSRPTLRRVLCWPPDVLCHPQWLLVHWGTIFDSPPFLSHSPSYPSSASWNHLLIKPAPVKPPAPKYFSWVIFGGPHIPPNISLIGSLRLEWRSIDRRVSSAGHIVDAQ